jgi:hypothetical protein
MRNFGASLFSICLGISFSTFAAETNIEISCNIRDNNATLACQWVGKERRAMTVDDISQFVDQAGVMAYITVKSRKGMERVFQIDSNAPTFKRLNEAKKSASISEVSRVKSEVFAEIEKRVTKLSDELDATASAAELIKYDPSIGTDKMRREARLLLTELEGFHKSRDQVCTSTPAYENLTKANASLQQILSNILFAFQTPGTCMDTFKVFKDKDGTVDLRQLDVVPARYKEACRK